LTFPDPSTLAVFSAAALLLLVIPGPAVLYIVAQSVSRGRVAGLVSMLGIQVGGLVHVIAAAVGLSALVVQSAVAFSTVKYAGAAYLVFLGVRRLLGRDEDAQGSVPRERRLRTLFANGIVVNVFNPKTALFFFAFLPQFITPSRGNVTTQMLFLGCLFVVLATLSDGVYALAAGSVGHLLKGNRRFVKGERYFAGTVYIGLGVTTAFSGSRSK
jgi:threonine/homoserine/homoserine lactone efflux protein